MRVISIDPGYERMGVAIIEKALEVKDFTPIATTKNKEHLLYSECLHTNKEWLFERRLCELGQKIETLIEVYKPDQLAIESLFVTKNQKTAMRVAEIRGAVLYLASKNKIEISEYSPPQIKLAVTGDGKSSKEQIIKMIHLLFNLKSFGLDQNGSFDKSAKRLDDEYDAIAIGLTHLAHTKGF